MATITLTFSAIKARQSNEHSVLSFAASAQEIMLFAQVERIGRNTSGDLFGFQRPQIESHIREIRDYMARDDAVVPNGIVVAFLASDPGFRVIGNEGVVQIEIDISDHPTGLVVDGQQRLSALAGLPERDFQLFVSALICPDEEELRRQFILINNTRPLPKGLIYELLPSVSGLPSRLSVRTKAAELTERLNFRLGPLAGKINQHTNPTGRIKDTAIQKLLMNSLSDGALQEINRKAKNSAIGDESCLRIVNNFFIAIQRVFDKEWAPDTNTPKTSRLVHSAGIIAMGFVLEELYSRHKARTISDFESGLQLLHGHTHWTNGSWDFGPEGQRPWNHIQNTNRDIHLLTDHLLHVLKRETRKHDLESSPLLQAVGE
jgi:DGQHR domain-containing protein